MILMAPFPEMREATASKLAISPEYLLPTVKDKQIPQHTSEGLLTTAAWS